MIQGLRNDLLAFTQAGLRSAGPMQAKYRFLAQLQSVKAAIARAVQLCIDGLDGCWIDAVEKKYPPPTGLGGRARNPSMARLESLIATNTRS
jgi:hypothetical protein